MTLDTLDLELRSVLPSIMGSGFDDPYPVYAYLRENCPVHRDASGVWLLSSHALITRMLDDRHFSARPPAMQPGAGDPLGYAGMIVFQHGDDHERLRRLLAPLFSRKSLARLQDFIDADIARLLAPLQHAGRFDLVAEVASVLPLRTICHLLGFPESNAANYLQASMGAWQLISGAQLTAGQRAHAMAQTQAFLDHIDTLVRAIDPDRSPDHPVAWFLQLEREGEFTRREMLVNILFLFIAGYGTTLLTIGNSVGAALRDTRAWRTLLDEPALVPQAVRELYRYDPAVQGIFRYAWQDTEFEGQLIRRGELAVLLLGAANRDPAEFASPNEIDLARAQGRSLTFGAGPHSCMGLSLARMQLESLLHALLQRMPDLQLAAAGSRRLQRGTFHGFDQLWLERPS
ncbi:cytochrome P450 [Paraburkholderia ginsengiterrae]|uniref:Cytochrome n=1 Tax=Paraburkholderia ginsengiterrae TaxID=1462993 RepID=A0A1A9NBH5_9BURK|nr:cytochrome P450 [Paraburkholderia ginsengiterrae]OAJ62844.1 cytochrome [Paraburkholderia ginsengiterrae]